MPADLSEKTAEELAAIIKNHRDRSATDRPLYADALAALAAKRGQGLDFEKSLRIILKAAREGRFLGYKQLAEESGASWARVHWSVGPHLDQMLEYCHRNEWPLLPSIVVRQDEVEGGRLTGSSLAGFIEGCRRLDMTIPDDHAEFAAEQQRRVFEWARRGASA